MKLKYKKVMDTAVAPAKGTEGSAAFDLHATSIRITSQFIEINSGISVEIPEGHFGMLVARSSISKTDMMLKNSVGIIDSDYRGTLIGRFLLVPYRNSQAPDFKEDFDLEVYQVGDKCMQLIIMPIPEIELEEVKELGTTKRGFGGFGSTGH